MLTSRVKFSFIVFFAVGFKRVLQFAGMFIHLTVHFEKKYSISAYSYNRCFGFPFHNFLTGSDTQKFRVSAYSRINTVIEIVLDVALLSNLF